MTAKPTERNGLSRVAAAQGAYYLATGIWPLVSIRSFEAVTGAKRDKWLVKTVGALVSAVGSVFALASKRHACPPEVRLLGIGSAIAFTAIDCIYVGKRRISPIYLLDAAAELALLVAWTSPPAGAAAAAADARLKIYLEDHHAGAVMGLELCKRAQRNNSGTQLGEVLARVGREIQEDRQTLLAVMGSLGFSPDPVKASLAWALEKLARLKLNGQLRGYSPLSRLHELEQLSLGIAGKLAMWRAFERLGESRLSSFDFRKLATRAERQQLDLEPLRLQAASEAFGPSRSSSEAQQRGAGEGGGTGAGENP